MKQNEIIVLAKQLDEKHVMLQEKLNHLLELRKQAETTTDEYVNYSDDKGFNVCTKVIDDETRFREKIIGQYAVVSPNEKNDLVYDGIYEKMEGGLPVGYFGYSQNGIEYFGELREQSFEGPLMVVFPDNGQKIITFVKDGVVKGFSKFISERETRYAPMVNSQPADGDVLIVFNNCTRLFAQVKKGELDTKGIVQTSKGDLFKGSFVNLPHQGEIFTGASSIYTGELERHTNLPIGNGVMHLLTEGKTFKGSFLNGMLEGKGTYTVDETGEKFTGLFNKGKVEGVGSHIMPGQFIYEGEFRNGVYHGQGKFSYDGSGSYEGQFIDGKFEGEGKIYTTEGDYLEGKFKDWNPDGELKFKNVSGKEYSKEEYQGKTTCSSKSEEIKNPKGNKIPNLNSNQTNTSDETTQNNTRLNSTSINKFSNPILQARNKFGSFTSNGIATRTLNTIPVSSLRRTLTICTIGLFSIHQLSSYK